MAKLLRSPPRDTKITSVNPELAVSQKDTVVKTSSSNTYHRAKRTRDDSADAMTAQFDDFKEEIKNLMRTLLAEQSGELAKVTKTLKEIQHTNNNIESTISYLAEQNEEFKKKIGKLENQIKEDRLYITILENKIEEMQINSRKSDLELKNVPKKNNETKEDLLEMITCLSKNIDCKIEKTDIKDIYRVRGKKNEQNRTPIIVETNSTIIKNNILKMAKSFNIRHKSKLCARHLGFRTQEDTPVFLSEHLTAKASRLYFLARELAKTKTYKYCWSAYGKVYIRKDEKSTVILIRNEDQIHQLRQET